MKYIILALFVLSANASLEKGWAVALKIKDSAEGFVGESSDMILELIDKDGSKVVRKMTGSSLEGNSTDKSIMTFTHPADVNGTKLLTWAHEEKDDDQWLYLTSVRRVKKISSKSKGSSFMGSEFSFEDLGGQAIEKYTFNLLASGKFKGKPVWRLERIAKNKSSYSRVIIYVDKKTYISLKSDYYNKRNELKKTAIASDIRMYKIKGKKHYRASKIVMKNKINGKSSVFIWKDRKIGKKIRSRNFDKSSLKK